MKKNLLLVLMMVFVMGITPYAHAELTLSGAQTYMLTFYSGGKDVNATTTGSSDEHGVTRDLLQIPSHSELVVKSKMLSDEGLGFGGEIQLQPTAGDLIVDEAFIHVEHESWGQVVVGNDDDALDRLALHGGSVLAGLAGEWKGTAHSIGGNDDDAKIVYLTPMWGSLRGAVSFTPSKKADALFTQGDNEGSSENSLALAGQYEGGFFGVDYKVGGGFRLETAFNRSRTVAEGSEMVVATESVGDMWGYQLGVMASYEKYSFSMGYGDMATNRKAKVFAADDVEADYRDSFLSFGGRYDYRKGGISLGYNLQSRTSNANIGTNFSGSATLLDLDYKLGEGLLFLLSASMNASDSDSLDSENDDNNRSETIFGLGLKAQF